MVTSSFLNSVHTGPQSFASLAQPIYQVLGPKYSENWFDLKGRTTATMILAIGVFFDVPSALGYLLICNSEPSRECYRTID